MGEAAEIVRGGTLCVDVTRVVSERRRQMEGRGTPKPFSTAVLRATFNASVPQSGTFLDPNSTICTGWSALCQPVQGRVEVRKEMRGPGLGLANVLRGLAVTRAYEASRSRSGRRPGQPEPR